MIRTALRITVEVASIAVTLRIVCGRKLAGPCPTCETRAQVARQRHDLDRLRAVADEQEAADMQQIMYERELDAFLDGLTRAAR